MASARLGQAVGFVQRAVLGNDSGWRRNLEGRRHLRLARAAVGPHWSEGTDDLTRFRAQQLASQGVVRFERDPLTDNAVDRAAERFQELIVDPAYRVDKGNFDARAHCYVRDAHLAIPELGELLTPEVIATIEAYYRSPFRVRTVRAYRNSATDVASESAEVYGDHWHLDPEITCDLRYFVYLSEKVTVDNGALWTLDIPTTRKAFRAGYLDRWHLLGPARRLVGLHGVVQSGLRGTGVLIDAQRALHRAGTVHPGSHRDVVQFWITPASVPLAPDWAAQLGPDPSFSGGLPGDG